MAITRFRIPFIPIQNLTPRHSAFSKGKGLVVNEKNGTKKYNIYIPYINRIKIIEGSSSTGKPLGCIWLGTLGGGLIGLGLVSQSSGSDLTGGMVTAIPLSPFAILAA